jgi:hypothetical protein
MYPLTNTFEFEYKYKYPYLYFSGYRYRIFGIYFHISIPNQNPLEKWNLEPIVVGWGADLLGLLRTYMRTQSRFFSTWDKWQPESNSNSPHPKLSLLFFWQKQKKSSPTVPISGCHLSQVGKNRLRARIYERSSPRRILPY